MPLAPLAVPSAAQQDIAALEQVPAAEPFLQRARAADASIALTPGDAPAVAELCRRLDGLPLALELAAARVRIGGPRRLLAALERGLDTLGSGARDLPARQRGLRAALDYTVSLLDEEPRRLLAALGVFASAWTIEQAEIMLGDQLDVWEATASLLDFALIRTRGDGAHVDGRAGAFVRAGAAGTTGARPRCARPARADACRGGRVDPRRTSARDPDDDQSGGRTRG